MRIVFLLALLPVATVAVALFIPPSSRFWLKTAAVLFVFVLGIWTYWRQFHVSYLGVREEHKGVIVNHLLSFLLIRYENLLKKQNSNPNFEVRVNVMEPKRKLREWRFRKHLSIDYSEGEYSDAEVEIAYAQGEGACGLAWENGAPVVFDAKTAAGPIKGLSAVQRDVTRTAESVLSIPIYRPEDFGKTNPVGILNLDSKAPIDRTRFDTEKIQDVAIKYANYIGVVL